MSDSEDEDTKSNTVVSGTRYAGTLEADWLLGLDEAAPSDDVTAAAEAERRIAGRFPGASVAAAAAAAPAANAAAAPAAAAAAAAGEAAAPAAAPAAEANAAE